MAPESEWVTDHDMSGFGVECRPYTHEELVALSFQDVKALVRLAGLVLPF